jgi:2-C-methyl-D-erythritol 4-phosphate cytidylyltransferase
MGPSVAAIICAAGSSSRMGGIKKEYRPLMPAPFSAGEKPLTVLAAVVYAFVLCPRIGPVVVAVPPGDEQAASASLPDEFFAGEMKGRVLFAAGGPTRRTSAHHALSLLEPFHPSHVLIHDGARPWIKRDLIEKIIDAAVRWGAVIPALPLIETPKELALPAAGELRVIKRHLRRDAVCAAQTPQGFAFPDILRAHEKAAERERQEGFEYTDDAEVWGEFMGPVAAIPGDAENRKITYPEDL